MPARLAKTKKQRNCKTKKLGAKSKRARENHGTTTSIPKEGPIPSLRFGKAVKAESIVVTPDSLK